MRKKITIMLIMLSIICMTACGKTADNKKISEKSKKEETGIFYSVIKDKKDLSGTTYNVTMLKSDEWAWVASEEIPQGYLGYLIEDFDQDGSDEMLLFELRNEVSICVSIYEEVNGVPQLDDIGLLYDLETCSDTLKQKWVYIPDGNYIFCEGNTATCTAGNWSISSFALFQYNGTTLDCIIDHEVRVDKLENDISFMDDLNTLCQYLDIKNYNLDSLIMRANFTDYIDDEIVITEVRQQLNVDYDSTQKIIDEAENHANDIPISTGCIYGRGGDDTTYVSLYETLLDRSEEKTKEVANNYDFDLNDLENTLPNIDDYAPVNIKFSEDIYLSFYVHNKNTQGSLKELKDNNYIYEYYMFNDGELVGDEEKADQFIIYFLPGIYIVNPSYNKFENYSATSNIKEGVEAYFLIYSMATDSYYGTLIHDTIIVEPTLNMLINENMYTTSYNFKGVDCPIITKNKTTEKEISWKN